MPSLQELVAILVVIAILWFVLKVARVALRLIFFFVGLAVIVGVLYFVFVR